jgi:RNA polymerase sigma factor (sigma-70 family)
MIAPMTDAADDDARLAALVAARTGTQHSLKQAQRAFTQLYLRHAPRVAAFLARQAPSGELDDIQQAVWSRVWQKLPGFMSRFDGVPPGMRDLPDRGEFRAWLFTLARNYLIDRSRKRHRYSHQDMQTIADLWSFPADEQLAEEEFMAQLRRCLNGLDAQSQAVVAGRMAGKSYAEICSQTGLPALKAHKLFHRAKRRIAACLHSGLRDFSA